MGIFYSHIVFQPPSPPTYVDYGGIMSFRNIRYDQEDPDEEARQSASSTASHSGSAASSNLVQHPLVYLSTSKGSVIPAAFFHNQDSYYTILFSHGNGEDLGITAPYALQLASALNASVLCYDYTGYGLATSSKPSESHCYADIRAAYNYLIGERRIPPHRILLFGRSLGSGPTIDLAQSVGTQLGGVVLIAALTSCVRVVFKNVSHTGKLDMFANIDKISRVRVPVFCVHGMQDEVVPFEHGLQLSRTARFPIEPMWVRGAGHNNLECAEFVEGVFRRYEKVLEQFKEWSPPAHYEGQSRRARRGERRHMRRRDSTGALDMAAMCFSGRRGERGRSISHGRLPSLRGMVERDEMELLELWEREGEERVLMRSGGLVERQERRERKREGDRESRKKERRKTVVHRKRWSMKGLAKMQQGGDENVEQDVNVLNRQQQQGVCV